MARTFPSQLVYRPGAALGPLLAATGQYVTLYRDAALTEPEVNLQLADGAVPAPDGRVLVDGTSRTPRLQVTGGDEVPTVLYVKPDGSTLATPIFSNAEQALAELEAAIASGLYVPAVVVAGPGIDPTGVADSTAAIKAKIDSVGPDGGLVFFPKGRYRLASSLVISGIANLTLFSAGNSATLVPDFVGTDGIRFEDCPLFSMSGVTVAVAGSVQRAVHYTATSSAQTALFERILIGPTEDGTLANGLCIGADTSLDVAEVTLLHCRVEGATSAGYLFGNGTAGNVLNIRGLGNVSVDNARGVHMNGCLVAWRDAGFVRSSLADFKVSLPNTTPLVIDGVRSEGSKRFLEWNNGNTFGSPTVVGGVVVSTFTDPDGTVIDYTSSAPLSLTGCTFHGGVAPARITLNAAGTNPLVFSAVNTAWQNDTPFVYGENVIATISGTRLLGPGLEALTPADGGAGVSAQQSRVTGVACTSTLTLTGTLQDVPGATATVTAPVAGNLFVTGTFDFTSGAAELLQGVLAVDGSDQANVALHTAVAGHRSTITQTWVVAAARGAHTVKLRASRITGSNAGHQVNALHTRLSVLFVPGG